VERVPEAGSSIEAAVALGEAAGADVASGPPDMPPALAPAAAEAAVVLVRRRYLVPRRRGRGNVIRPAERQPCPCAAKLRGAAPVAPVPDP
jgi:hypothetical protein